MEEKDEVKDEPSYTFDFDTIPILNELTSLHQEGNYLSGVTSGGVRFKHRIPNDKMLTKNEKGEWAIVPLRQS